MKYLKTYNDLNELLRDKMKGKSDKDIIFNLLSENDKYEALKKSLMKEYIPGIKYILKGDDVSNDKKYKEIFVDYIVYLSNPENVKYLLDIKDIKDFFTDDQIYILEKFYFGMHKDKTIVYEELVDEFMEDVKNVNKKDGEDWINYEIYTEVVFTYVHKDKLLICRMGTLNRYFFRWYKLDDLGKGYGRLLLAISFSKFFNKEVKIILKL